MRFYRTANPPFTPLQNPYLPKDAAPFGSQTPPGTGASVMLTRVMCILFVIGINKIFISSQKILVTPSPPVLCCICRAATVGEHARQSRPRASNLAAYSPLSLHPHRLTINAHNAARRVGAQPPCPSTRRATHTRRPRASYSARPRPVKAKLVHNVRDRTKRQLRQPSSPPCRRPTATTASTPAFSLRCADSLRCCIVEIFAVSSSACCCE